MNPGFWLARVATQVAVRRVVTILVLALLAWVGIGRAQAEDFPACFTDDVSGACSGMDTAWAAARQAAANRAAGNDRAIVACENHYPASASVQVR